MRLTPRLSICVPSRNRQFYLAATVSGMLRHMREDVELVIADNSDDPAPIADFVASLPAGAPITYLPPADRVLSMQDNWERTVSAARGDWITVIGDDDHLDPDLAGMIGRIEALSPGVEAISWPLPHFEWPHPSKRSYNFSLWLRPMILRVERQTAFGSAFRWDNASIGPTGTYSIYHSAISRGLAQRVRATFGGNYFGHPTVDYDFAFKVAALCKSFIHVTRPFSIMGVCQESNSASIGDPDRMEAICRTFYAELGRNMDEDPWMADFPFPAALGVTPAIAQVNAWLAHQYGLPKLPGWDENFVAACQLSCDRIRNRAHFDRLVEGYRRGFSAYQGGRYLESFNPQFGGDPAYEVYTGVKGDKLYIDQSIGHAETPADFFEIIESILGSIDTVPLELRRGDLSLELIPTAPPLQKTG